ncbi:hypothetical protein LTR86_008601 [Recurvomyces mirabilis]|nr:hypothetical protein LTR86_008601 [Recurvomyces mirabilis]
MGVDAGGTSPLRYELLSACRSGPRPYLAGLGEETGDTILQPGPHCLSARDDFPWPDLVAMAVLVERMSPLEVMQRLWIRAALLTCVGSKSNLKMENSPLSRLPAELRSQIYELALTVAQPIEIKLQHDTKTVKAAGVPLALTSTCRSIRKETLKLFYSINKFVLRTNYLYLLCHGHDDHTDASMAPFFEWIDIIGSDKLELMRDLTLDLDCTEIHGLEGAKTCASFREHWSTATKAPWGPCNLQGPILRHRQPCRIKFGVCMGLHDGSRPTVDTPVDNEDFNVEFMLGSARALTEKSLRSTEDKILAELRAERPAGDYSLVAGMIAMMCQEVSAKVREIVLDVTPW